MTNNTNQSQAKRKMSFITQVRIMRRMQDILEQRGDAVSLAVFDKIECILNGDRGVRFSAIEKGRQESVFVMAKFALEKEKADYNLQKYGTASGMTRQYQESNQEFDVKEVQA